MKIGFRQAKTFLSNLNFSDKVGIICHDDLDGMCSAVLISDFCKNKNAKHKVFIFNLQKQGLKIFENKLKVFNKIVVLDIQNFYVSNHLKKLEKTFEILYIDHHSKEIKISDFILEYNTNEKIPVSKTVYDLTKNKKWLAVLGTVSDFGDKYKENQEFVSSFLKENNLTLDSFRKNIVFKFGDLLAYFSNKKEAFRILEKANFNNLSEIQKYSSIIRNETKKIEKDFKENNKKYGNINIYQFKSKYDLRSGIITKLSLEKPSEIFIFIEKQPCQMIRLSTRHQEKKGEAYTVLKKGGRGLKDTNIGGHPQAAGGFIKEKDLKQFFENIILKGL